MAQTGGGNVAGADPELVGAGDWLDWANVMEKGGVELVEIENIIDNLWTEENGRPPNLFKVGLGIETDDDDFMLHARILLFMILSMPEKSGQRSYHH